MFYFQGIQFLSHHGDVCVAMVTPSSHPYIDKITPSLGVVIGGNGWAGKSSDEIGRVAAQMMLNNTWTYDIPAEMFKLHTQRTLSKL